MNQPAVIPKLEPSQIAHAQYLQRKGYTLSEIAAQMGVARELVVEALYYDVVRA